jgi:uncharacterized delta-60 repeat protein
MKKLLFVLSVLFTTNIYNAVAQGGTYDLSFNGTGKVITGFPGVYVAGQANGIQTDGKIVAGGYYTVNGDIGFAFARYNTDGTLDATYGKSGLATSAYSFISSGVTFTYGFLNDIAVQGDNKIVFTGFCITEAGTVNVITGRMKTDGTLDSAFGNNGFVVHDVANTGTSNQAYGIAVQADGKILVGGYLNSGGFIAVRYQSSGKADSSFGVNGVVRLDVGLVRSGANSIALQADGKILMAGLAATAISNVIALVRLMPDGHVDEAFGVHGRVTTDIRSLGDAGNCVTVASSGKIIVAGSSNDVLYSDFALAIYNTDGTLVKKTVLDVNTYSDVANSVVVQTDGRIILAGYANNATASLLSAARFNPDGTLDLTFGVDGKLITDISYSGVTETGMFIQSDDKIVITGTKDVGDTSKFATVRLLRGPVLSINKVFADNSQLTVYPNPVAERSTISYQTNIRSNVSIDLYDLQGKFVTKFLQQQKEAGVHNESIVFPESISAGNYYMRLSTESGTAQLMITKK